MSIEGSPDRLEACTLGGEPEDAVLDGQSCDETRGTYLPAGRESPLLNGVVPTGQGAPPLESRTPEGGRTQQGEDRHRQNSGLETMIRRLVAQNQMLQEELTSARLESRRTSSNEPETGSYRTFVPPWTQMSGWDDPHQLSIAEAEVRRQVPLDFQVRRQVPLDFQVRRQVPLDFQVRRQVPMDFQVRRQAVDFQVRCQVPMDFQVRRQVPVDFQVRRQVPVDFQVRRQVPVDSQVRGQVPLDFQVKRQVPLDFQVRCQVPVDFWVRRQVPEDF
eukprot:s749_g16.t1